MLTHWINCNYWIWRVTLSSLGLNRNGSAVSNHQFHFFEDWLQCNFAINVEPTQNTHESDFSMLKFGLKFKLNVVTESITEGFWHLTVEISELPILKISNAIDFHSLLRLFVMITSGIVQFMHFAISNVWPGISIYPKAHAMVSKWIFHVWFTWNFTKFGTVLNDF